MSKTERKPKPILLGTIRIRSKDLKVVEKGRFLWKKSKRQMRNAMAVIKLFKAHKKFDILVDTKDPKFLKGQISPDGMIQGARINILPDGTKIDKAFNLFAEDLVVHGEASHDHWDVLYKNPGGTYSYVYSLEKKKNFKNMKYKKVEEFAKNYPTIKRKVTSALLKKDDDIAVPMYTLLKTYMRIGNEIYYKTHGHKGLTTLKKKDITIQKDMVTFNYLSKDGVPRTIQELFPKSYINRLSNMLKGLDNKSFVFVNKNSGHPLRDTEFMKAFKNYCGIEFYPHIVRSHYATERAKEFLKNNKVFTITEMKEFFTDVASKLGHMKFDKKNNVWKESPTTTMNNYIQPELVEKIKSRVGIV